MSTGPRPLVLVAHGSRDPRAARSTRALARAVGAARPDVRVETAFLDFSAPGLNAALRREADRGQDAATVVPLLLTAAYHGRVDVPGEIEKASDLGLAIGLAAVLGPVGGARSDRVALDLVVRALKRRLTETYNGPVGGLVLLAAGSRERSALDTVDVVADALGAALGVPCVAGYASGAGRTPAEAMATLDGPVVAASYFLAPGLLYDRAAAGAVGAGAVAVAAPTGDAPEIAELVLTRANAA
jgi:sirohydrochlorin ferrochelatase